MVMCVVLDSFDLELAFFVWWTIFVIPRPFDIENILLSFALTPHSVAKLKNKLLVKLNFEFISIFFLSLDSISVPTIVRFQLFVLGVFNFPIFFYFSLVYCLYLYAILWTRTFLQTFIIKSAYKHEKKSLQASFAESKKKN